MTATFLSIMNVTVKAAKIHLLPHRAGIAAGLIRHA
jgi:hypothetical protein